MVSAVYSRPASGLLTGWPPRELGTDLVKALHLVGARAGVPHAAAGWIVWPDGKAPVALAAMDIEPARAIAHELASQGTPVTLGRAVGRGRVTLYERVERVEKLDRVVALGDRLARLVAPNGVLVHKSFVPRAIDELLMYAQQLGGLLMTADRQIMQPKIVEALEAMGDRVNWKNPTPAQMEEAWAAARRVMVGATKQLMPVWEDTMTVAFNDVANANRATLRETYLPRLATTMRQPDQRAIEQMGVQQGWFLRNEVGMRSTALSAQGQKIVQDGLAQGLGRTEIAADLRQQLPNLWGAMGKNYSIACAAVGVSRARSFSEVASYQEAGIQQLEVVAIIDERTSDICRAMDGMIIPVSAARSLIDAGAQVGNPEDIKTVNPFMRQSGPGGSKLVTANGGHIADVLRSGRGKVDDIGITRYHVVGSGLPQQGIGAPPYHFRCRTLTVPRMGGGVPVGMENGGRGVGPPPSILPPIPPPKIVPPPVERPIVPVIPGGVPIGAPPAIDRIPLPVDYVRDPGIYAWQRGLKDGRVARVMFQDQANPGTWTKAGGWMKEGSLADGMKFVKPGDMVVDCIRKGPPSVWGNGELLDLATVKGVEGRNMLYRLRTTGDRGGEMFMRVEQNAPTSKLRDMLAEAKLQAPSVEDSRLADMITKGKAEGWLKIGKLAEVSKPQAERVAALPPPEVKQKKVKPLVAPTPVPQVKPVVPPEPPLAVHGKDGPDKKQPSPPLTTSTRDHVVAPPRDMMRKIVTDGMVGYKSTGHGAAFYNGKWQYEQLGHAGSKTPDWTFLNKTSDPHVKIVMPYSLGMSSAKSNLATPTWAMTEIMKVELQSARTAIREITMRDTRGATWFIRIDPAALRAAPPDIQQDIKNVWCYSGTKRDKIVKRLRQYGTMVTNDIREFRKGIEVDWTQPGLIPGVRVQEQAERRVAAIKSEIADVVASLQKTLSLQSRLPLDRWTPEARREKIGTAIRDHLMMTRERTGSIEKSEIIFSHKQDDPNFFPANEPHSVKMQNTGTAHGYMQAALKYASQGQVNAATERKIPVFFHGKYGERAYQSSGQGLIMFSGKPDARVITHEVAHWNDDTGYNGAASVHVRNMNVKDGPMTYYGEDRGKKEWTLPGKWVDNYEAKEYHVSAAPGFDPTKTRTAEEWQTMLHDHLEKNIDNPIGHEYSSMAAERFVGNPFTDQAGHFTRKLGEMVEQAPEQAAVFIAQMRGHFVPPPP